MRYVLVMATLPMVTIWASTPRPAPPIEPMPVTTEGIRAQRIDENTFRRRWELVDQLPPAMIREVHYLVVTSDEEVGAMPGAALSAPQAPLPRHRPISMRERSIDAGTAHRRHLVVSAMASRPASLCARHGMRTVTIGRTWRCRR